MEGQVERYIPGGVVRMGIAVQHKMYLNEVLASFVHEEKAGTSIILSGEPSFSDAQWVGIQGVTRSEAELVTRIMPEDVPGIYRLQRLTFLTYGGKTFVRRGEEELGDAASARFEVLPEPEDKPGLERLEFL